MTFYIGDTIEEIIGDEYGVDIDDDLSDYLYLVKKQIPFTVFFNIDPYSDVEIREEDIPDLISMCRYILDAKLLENYYEEEKEEAISTFKELINLGEEALKEKKKLISIGD